MVKPLQSAEVIERRNNRNKRIIGIVIIALLVLSTAGFALTGLGGNLGSTDTTLPDGEVVYNGQYWIYSVSGQQFYFTHKKEDVNIESFTFNKGFADFAGKPLYIDTESPAVLNEVSLNLGRFVTKMQEVCYGSCDRDLPEKDCSENLISFKESQTASIREQENCVFIEGDLKTVDAFLYKVLGLN
jgi:hypothetical protein